MGDPPNHPDLVINSIGVQIIGADLSGILSAQLLYFPLAGDGVNPPPSVSFPLAISVRSASGALDYLTITESLNCFCPAQTVAILQLAYANNNPPAGTQLQANITFTYEA